MSRLLAAHPSAPWLLRAYPHAPALGFLATMLVATIVLLPSDPPGGTWLVTYGLCLMAWSATAWAWRAALKVHPGTEHFWEHSRGYAESSALTDTRHLLRRMERCGLGFEVDRAWSELAGASDLPTLFDSVYQSLERACAATEELKREDHNANRYVEQMDEFTRRSIDDPNS